MSKDYKQTKETINRNITGNVRYVEGEKLVQ
jgi:hypothetical protein